MSLTDDLALVTACRDAPHLDRRLTPLVDCTLAALSLIEDTLNRHAPVPGFIKVSNSTQPEPPDPICAICRRRHPCVDYKDHLAALHTIAAALGVEVLTKEGES